MSDCVSVNPLFGWSAEFSFLSDNLKNVVPAGHDSPVKENSHSVKQLISVSKHTVARVCVCLCVWS